MEHVKRLGFLGKQILPYAAIVLLALVTAALVYQVLFSTVEIGTPATESEALVRSSERLIQLVQWTISTILIIGGGLIGINWYRDGKRYERDREDLDKAIRSFEQFKGETEGRIRALLDESVHIVFTDTVDRMTSSTESPAEMFRVLRMGYERIRQLEQPETYRTGLLLSNGLMLIEATEGIVALDSGPEQDVSLAFLTIITQDFSALDPRVRNLRSRIRFQQ